MEKILIQVKNKIIYIKHKKSLKEKESNLLNTNIITDNELIFSSDYILDNTDIVTKFLMELIIHENVDTMYLYKTTLTSTFIDLLDDFDSISNLIVKDDLVLTGDMIKKIGNNKNIDAISVISIYDFFIDYLDKKGKIVEVRNELFLTSDFARNNELLKYTNLYYKRIISLSFPFTDKEDDDFSTFISVNKYLKVIHINKISKVDLEYVIDKLKEYSKENIRIILHDNVNSEELVTYIKKSNKINKLLPISVSYSDKYLGDNLLPQANMNILKMCFYTLMLFVVGTLIYYSAENYFSYTEDVSLKDEIQEYIIQTDISSYVEEIEKETEKKVMNEEIAALMLLNMDAVGWISVNNTRVDYPIVQTTNNSYYLKYNIKKEYTDLGSIYMNYTNDRDFLNDNTILFGHTFLSSNVMFGSLVNIRDEAWRSDESNLEFTVDTLYETLTYRIFSFYIIKTTNDYLRTSFSSDLERLSFYHTLRDRSEYVFDTDLKYNDRIITLSTCANNGTSRLVVHAVLID